MATLKDLRMPLYPSWLTVITLSPAVYDVREVVRGEDLVADAPLAIGVPAPDNDNDGAE